MSEPLVSIIVSLYNYKKYIGYCIRSIINQDYENYELIVVDDCSIDGSYGKAKKFENEKIKIIQLKKNYGYSKAKNEGIIRSKGDYIVTIDADDMMTKNSISSRLKVAIKHNVPFVYADAIKVVGSISLEDCYRINIEKIRKKRKKYVVYDPSIDLYNIHAQSIMIHRDIYKKYGLYDEDLRSRSDREMWWRLFGKNEFDIKRIPNYYLNKPVAYYRAHRFSMWHKRKKKPEYDKEIIRLSEKAYKMRKKQGINKNNTRFLEK